MIGTKGENINITAEFFLDDRCNLIRISWSNN